MQNNHQQFINSSIGYRWDHTPSEPNKQTHTYRFTDAHFVHIFVMGAVRFFDVWNICAYLKFLLLYNTKINKIRNKVTEKNFFIPNKRRKLRQISKHRNEISVPNWFDKNGQKSGVTVIASSINLIANVLAVLRIASINNWPVRMLSIHFQIVVLHHVHTDDIIYNVGWPQIQTLKILQVYKWRSMCIGLTHKNVFRWL